MWGRIVPIVPSYRTLRRTDLDVFVPRLFRTNTKLLIWYRYALHTLLVFSFYVHLFNCGWLQYHSIHLANLCKDEIIQLVRYNSWKTLWSKKKPQIHLSRHSIRPRMDMMASPFFTITSIRGYNQGSWPRKASKKKERKSDPNKIKSNCEWFSHIIYKSDSEHNVLVCKSVTLYLIGLYRPKLSLASRIAQIG